MEAKAYNEAARALILWGALQVDLVRRSQTEEEREAANDLISLLTPVIKGYLTDKGYEVATNAQQIYGGHGYIREWGMEQFVRDARINMIYEGANGIQALDLVGRKLGPEWRPRDPGLFQAARRGDRRRQGREGEAADIAAALEKGGRRPPDRDDVADAERPWPIPTMPAPRPTAT